MAQWAVRRAEPADAVALTACVDAAYAAWAARIDDLPAVAEGLAADIAMARKGVRANVHFEC